MAPCARMMSGPAGLPSGGWRFALGVVCLLGSCCRFSFVSAVYLVAGVFVMAQRWSLGAWRGGWVVLAVASWGYACVGGLFIFQAVLAAQDGGYATAPGYAPGGDQQLLLRQLGLNVLRGIPWYSVIRLVLPDVAVAVLLAAFVARRSGRCCPANASGRRASQAGEVSRRLRCLGLLGGPLYEALYSHRSRRTSVFVPSLDSG